MSGSRSRSPLRIPRRGVVKPSRSSASEAYEMLLEAIESGSLRPGTRLRETELADRFAISRTPVREALKRLETQGLVVHEPHHGAVVATLDYGQTTELYLMREVLEGTAARLAAIHATATEVEVLREMVARDRTLVAVVEQPKDLIQLESTGAFRGTYHVLLGHLATLENIGPSQLTILQLLERITAARDTDTPVREVILALNPTTEGDHTALYLQQELSALGVAVTRLARGLPLGAQIEYSNKAILADALTGRTKL